MERLTLLILLITSGCAKEVKDYDNPEWMHARAYELFTTVEEKAAAKLKEFLSKQTTIEEKYSIYYSIDDRQKYKEYCEQLRQQEITRVNETIYRFRLGVLGSEEFYEEIKRHLGAWFIEYVQIVIPDDRNISMNAVKQDIAELSIALEQIEQVCRPPVTHQ